MLEPFVFTAILQFFIEFPAIQDLIYTKVCFQVLTEYGFNSSDLNSQLRLIVPTIQDLNIPKNATNLHNEIDITSMTNASDGGIELHQICSRINKSAVPIDLRLKILDQDSLFWFRYQLVICILSILASPYWSGISDRIGRLIPMNVPVLASLFCNIFSLIYGALISIDSHARLNLDWLYVGAVLAGLSGGQSVLISNSFGFLSDNTSNEERTKRVTALELTIVLAHSFGFFLSKHMMSLGMSSGHISSIWENKYFVAFGSCALLDLICIMYSTFVLSLKNNFDRQVQITAAATTSQTIRDTSITFHYYKQTYSSVMKARESRQFILWFLLASFISTLCLTTLMSLLFVYVRTEPFNWTTSQYSAWNSLSAIVRGIALIALTLCMKFYSNWSVPDILVAALGFLSKFSGLLLIALAQYSSHLYWALACLSLSEYAMPPIRSLVSKLVPQEELCKVYGCMGSLQSVCFIFGNTVFYLALNQTLGARDYYRIGFIIVSGLELFAMIVMLVVHTSLKSRKMII